MRVLLLVTLSDWGGAQACVYALARGLRDRYDVVVGCAPGGPLVARLRADGIAVVELPTLRRTPAPLDDLRTLWRLVRWMRAARFAVVHCHSTKAGLLGRLAARLAGVPAAIFTAHGWPFVSGWPPPVRWAATLAERVVARFTSAIVCVAEQVRQEALSLRIGRPDRLVLIYNGTDPDRWPPRSRAQAAGSTVVTVGRLQPPKDPATLLAAWRRVPPGHRLLVLGDGPLRPALEAAAADLTADGTVTFLGARADVAQALADADVFVLSSRWEGLPFAVIEAMMVGLPVVASRVGGVEEAVVDGLTGFLVPPEDEAALAAALTRLLRDPDLREAMGREGRRRALELFTERAMVEQTAGLYAAVLAGAPVHHAPARGGPGI